MSMTNDRPFTHPKSDRMMPRFKPMDITVLAGGPGVEREVSLKSGHAVYEALVKLGHRVKMGDITADRLNALNWPTDFIFIALHGEFGEDGTLQALLDERDLKYSGCDAAASRLAMNKVEAKQAFQRAGILTPPYEVVTEASLPGLLERIVLPVVVKPIDSGSSVDTIIVRSGDDLVGVVSRLVKQYGEILVEEYIAGPELTVAVLGEVALPVCEIRTSREFYDYEAKYLSDDTEYSFEIDLSENLLAEVQRQSVQAHHALGCEVLSRVDWMVDQKTQLPYVLEINTIPGFTSHSLVPKAAAQVGLSFNDLCQKIVDLSLLKRTTTPHGIQ